MGGRRGGGGDDYEALRQREWLLYEAGGEGNRRGESGWEEKRELGGGCHGRGWPWSVGGWKRESSTSTLEAAARRPPYPLEATPHITLPLGFDVNIEYAFYCIERVLRFGVWRQSRTSKRFRSVLT